MTNIKHNTVEDLLTDINRYTRTFTNYAAVFNIKLSDYFIGAPMAFTEQQLIHRDLYQYFKRNKSFIKDFYADWHMKKTMGQLADNINQDVSKVLDLFNNGKIFMNRITNISFTEKTEFRYYSSYQVVELLTGEQVVPRPYAFVEL